LRALCTVMLTVGTTATSRNDSRQPSRHAEQQLMASVAAVTARALMLEAAAAPGRVLLAAAPQPAAPQETSKHMPECQLWQLT
jgi:hypothetical protein